MAFHFINSYKALGFGYETCLQNFINITDTHKTYTFKILKIKYYKLYRYIIACII